MPRKKVEDRVNAKRKARNKKADPKKLPPRFHKSHMPPMRKPVPYELPEEVCARLGHKDFILAQGANKKIVICSRLCGYFKTYVVTR